MDQFAVDKTNYVLVDDRDGMQTFLRNWPQHRYLAPVRCKKCNGKGLQCTFRIIETSRDFKKTCENCERYQCSLATGPNEALFTATASVPCPNCNSKQKKCYINLAKDNKQVRWSVSCVSCRSSHPCGIEIDNPTTFFLARNEKFPVFRHNIQIDLYYLGNGTDFQSAVNGGSSLQSVEFKDVATTTTSNPTGPGNSISPSGMAATTNGSWDDSNELPFTQSSQKSLEDPHGKQDDDETMMSLVAAWNRGYFDEQFPKDRGNTAITETGVVGIDAEESSTNVLRYSEDVTVPSSSVSRDSLDSRESRKRRMSHGEQDYDSRGKRRRL